MMLFLHKCFPAGFLFPRQTLTVAGGAGWKRDREAAGFWRQPLKSSSCIRGACCVAQTLQRVISLISCDALFEHSLGVCFEWNLQILSGLWLQPLCFILGSESVVNSLYFSFLYLSVSIVRDFMLVAIACEVQGFYLSHKLMLVQNTFSLQLLKYEGSGFHLFIFGLFLLKQTAWYYTAASQTKHYCSFVFSSHVNFSN